MSPDDVDGEGDVQDDQQQSLVTLDGLFYYSLTISKLRHDVDREFYRDILAFIRRECVPRYFFAALCNAAPACSHCCVPQGW